MPGSIETEEESLSYEVSMMNRICLPIVTPILLTAIYICLLIPSGCSNQVPGDKKEPQGAFLDFPREGAYTGAYIDFGETEDVVTLDAIEDFEKLVGKHQAVIAFSNFWGEESFPRKALHIVSRHGSLPLVFWSPWDRPYVEERGPDRFSVENILSGMWDAYIDGWADAARAHGSIILVSWGLEMNGSWFPWSGYYLREAPGDGSHPLEGSELYKRAFRYVVDRVRSRGAHNVLWGFHCNNRSYPEEDWNRIANYYPGKDYVDWLGLSVYGMQVPDDPWISFHAAMDSAYREMCGLDPSKPVILAEWGVGEFPSMGNKATWIQEAFAGLREKYTQVRAAIYWHERWKNADESFSNLRVNSSPESLESYRKGVRDPYWLSHLQFSRRGENR